MKRILAITRLRRSTDPLTMRPMQHFLHRVCVTFRNQTDSVRDSKAISGHWPSRDLSCQTWKRRIVDPIMWNCAFYEVAIFERLRWQRLLFNNSIIFLALIPGTGHKCHRASTLWYNNSNSVIWSRTFYFKGQVVTNTTEVCPQQTCLTRQKSFKCIFVHRKSASFK